MNTIDSVTNRVVISEGPVPVNPGSGVSVPASPGVGVPAPKPSNPPMRIVDKVDISSQSATNAPAGQTARKPADIVYHLGDPSQYVLNADKFPKEVLTGFKDELQKFKTELLAFKANPALTPSDPTATDAQANSLGNSAANLAGKVDLLMNQVQNLINPAG